MKYFKYGSSHSLSFMSMSVYVRGFYFPISFVKVLFLLYVFF